MRSQNNDSDGLPANRLLLTFRDGLAEKEFLTDRNPSMRSGLRVFARTMFAMSFVGWAWIIVQFQSGSVFLTQAGSVVTLQVLSSLGMVLSRNQGKYCQLRAEALEGVSIAGIILIEILGVVIDGYYSAKASGGEKYAFGKTGVFFSFPISIEECDYYSDSRILLVLVGSLLCAHFALSCRYSRVVLVDVFSNLLYGIIGLIYGSPEGLTNYIINVAFLAACTWIAVTGHRRVEGIERRRFSSIRAAERDLVRERVLRYETEFELDKFTHTQQAHIQRRPSAPSESSASAYKTNISSIVADPQEHLWDLRLQALQELAIKEYWWIPRSDLSVDWQNQLGKGGCGSVFQGELHYSAVAVKVAFTPDSAATDEAMDRQQSQRANALVNEIRILRRVRHPNIITLYGASVGEGPGRLLVIEELAKGQSLGNAVNMSSIVAAPWQPSGYGSILLGICAGLSHLHAQQPEIVHGDLKPANIMLSSDGTPKLVDFGLSRLLSKKRTFGGSTAWAAPEIFQFSAVKHFSMDVFSFGCVAYFVATSLKPFSQAEQTHPNNVAALPWPRQLSAFQVQCKALCDLSIVYKPEDRSSTCDLLDLIVKMAREGRRQKLNL
eukprot:TRINITY_DN16546_c0_g1_i3.p1 TRINITY_DN16546_c0_g1~~TRINITY_DN16546_c0_g1_i3.p1  ORF type:complete len:608 (+),score=67.12 TRINITY_DN16546_c0_g1_i3:95-1918(+)